MEFKIVIIAFGINNLGGIAVHFARYTSATATGNPILLSSTLYTLLYFYFYSTIK